LFPKERKKGRKKRRKKQLAKGVDATRLMLIKIIKGTQI